MKDEHPTSLLNYAAKRDPSTSKVSSGGGAAVLLPLGLLLAVVPLFGLLTLPFGIAGVAVSISENKRALAAGNRALAHRHMCWRRGTA